jgi:uncharacterized protein YecT (DUF1311 family)
MNQPSGRELKFVELHLNAFIDDLRGETGSPDELTALNNTDTAWRVYRESSCSLAFKRLAGPLEDLCRQIANITSVEPL